MFHRFTVSDDVAITSSNCDRENDPYCAKYGKKIQLECH